MKTLSLAFLLLTLSLGFTQEMASLSGEVLNPIGEKVYLRNFVQKDGRWAPNYFDSCQLNNGKFTLNAKLDSLTAVQFWDGNEVAFLYMKPGENLTMSVNTKYFDETLRFNGDGADRNQMWQQIFMIAELMQQKNSMAIFAYQKQDEKDTTELFAKVDQMDSTFIDFLKDQQSRFPDSKTYLENKIKSTSMSSERLKNSIRKGIKMEVLKEELKGQLFIDFAGVSLDGKDSKLSDYYGDIIVLDFWATWCGPCKAQFPDMHKLEKQYEGKVTFLSVAVSCKKKDWKKMAKEEGFKYNIYLEKEEFKKLSEAYIIATIPRYIILDAQGNIINLTAARPSGELSTQLDDLLN